MRAGRLLLILALAVALALTLPHVYRVVAKEAMEEAPRVWVVQPGDTLWAIAEQVQGGGDPRRLVAEIRRWNNLSGAAIHPGQQLRIPPAAAAFSRG